MEYNQWTNKIYSEIVHEHISKKPEYLEKAFSFC